MSWDPPTTNTDGTPLTDLAGYKVYFGITSQNYSHTMDVGNVTVYTVGNLTEGLVYYFAVTAYDTSGNESEYSNEASKTMQFTQQYTLTVNKGGTGSGAVTSSLSGINWLTSSLSGINCGSDCSAMYDAGTSVTLAATPDTSSAFTGWSGSGCAGAGTCTVTLDAAKTVTAIFTLRTYTVTATACTGGSISPFGSVSLNHGANQTFTITPNTYYNVKYVLVDGNSIGAVKTYTFIDVTANHNISASFIPSDYDNDGIHDIEEQGPQSDNANYDGNNDQIPDYLQDSVASFHTFDNTNYITLFSLNGEVLRNVTAEQVPQGAPSGANFPYQFLEFIVENLTQGTSASIVIKLPEGGPFNEFYKYGPTPNNPTPHWYNFTYDGQTGAEISGYIVTLHFIDGLRGDDDITVNGQILHQGEPARTSEITIYEDAEDGTIQGWDIYANYALGANISNVYDEARKSRVIQLTGSGTFNGYQLRKDDMSAWNNSAQLIIEWTMKYSEDFVVFISVETTAGHQYLYYTPSDYSSLGTGQYVHHGLGNGISDGQWHTAVRDLQADLQEAQPGVSILRVNAFLIRGSGRVDDIKLRTDFPTVYDDVSVTFS